MLYLSYICLVVKSCAIILTLLDLHLFKYHDFIYVCEKAVLDHNDNFQKRVSFCISDIGSLTHCQTQNKRAYIIAQKQDAINFEFFSLMHETALRLRTFRQVSGVARGGSEGDRNPLKFCKAWVGFSDLKCRIKQQEH